MLFKHLYDNQTTLKLYKRFCETSFTLHNIFIPQINYYSMENRYVGYILLGVSLLLIFNITSFNSIIKDMNADSCTEDDCIYHQSFNNMYYMSLVTIILLVIVAIILIFAKPHEKLIIQTKTKTIHKKPEKKKINLTELKPEEKEVLNLIRENKAIFQADLIEKTGFGKAKMTRIIDRLEGKEIVERKRRGMTNVVVLKDS